MIFTAADYATLASIVFRDDYPGHATARGVVEAPNGDPAARDVGKRYSHVADKYIGPYETTNRLLASHLDGYLEVAWEHASDVAFDLRVPRALMPSYLEGTLRVLEYPASVGASARHTDFDLFTINCYRNVPNPGLPDTEMHMGELGELVGLGPATPHHVDPIADQVQHSIVYFAMPSHAAVLPSGQTVGEWVAERKARSRTAMERT